MASELQKSSQLNVICPGQLLGGLVSCKQGLGPQVISETGLPLDACSKSHLGQRCFLRFNIRLAEHCCGLCTHQRLLSMQLAHATGPCYNSRAQACFGAELKKPSAQMEINSNQLVSRESHLAFFHTQQGSCCRGLTIVCIVQGSEVLVDQMGNSWQQEEVMNWLLPAEAVSAESDIHEGLRFGGAPLQNIMNLIRHPATLTSLGRSVHPLSLIWWITPHLD